MTDYIQYHKIHELGQPTSTLGDFSVFTSKPVNNVVGSRVWLISGDKRLTQYVYHLEYMFTVEQVERGATNVMRGQHGKKPFSSIKLNGYPWFVDLKKKHNNFRFGFREAGDEFVTQLEGLFGVC